MVAAMRLIRHPLSFCLTVFAALIATPAMAQSTLAPFKDGLFANRVVEERDGGAFRVVGYDEMRDINGRDAVPERRAKRAYLDLSVRRQESALALQTQAGLVPFIATGKTRGASIITIFLHGQGGDEKLGSRDLTFGGNFNRIRNLMARNSGLYVTPTFRDFGETGAEQIASLIDELLKRSPDAEVIVACGSMGGAICHRLANRASTVADLAGLIFLAAPPAGDFLSSTAFRARVPVFIAHGSRDPVFAIDDAERLYEQLRNGTGTYPVRMDRYESGNHGTPIRMVDWRRTINWMLSN